MRTKERCDQSLHGNGFVNDFRREYWDVEEHSEMSRIDVTAVAPSSAAVKAAPLRSVLVLLDGSNYAEHAVPIALEIARRAGANVLLAHVQLLLGSTDDDRSLSFEEAPDSRRKKRMAEYVDAFSRRLSAESSVAVAPAVYSGRGAADAIATIARRDNLIVLATRHRGALGWFHFGSVAERFLSLGSSSILFVRGYRGPIDLDAPVLLRRVATVLDGSAKGERIFKPAAALAESVRARHTLLSVVPNMPYAGIPWKEKVDEASSYLNGVANALSNANEFDNGVTTDVRSSDEAIGQVILAYAQRSESDVIAIAARSRSWLSKLFRTDPAEYLVRNSRIPVLVARS